MVYSAAGGNAGDDAIFYAVRDRFARLFPGATVTLACSNPANLQLRPGDRVVQTLDQVTGFFLGRSWFSAARRHLSETLAAMRASDLVVVGGGGLLNDMFGLRWLSQWVAAPILGQWLRKPVVLHGVGVGPLRSRTARWLVRRAVRSATAVTVRDDYSAGWLTRIGIPPHRVRTTADPVFGLRCRPSVIPRRDTLNWVGIVPRFDGPEGTDALIGYRTLAEQLSRAGWVVRMLPLSRYDHQRVGAARLTPWQTVEHVHNPFEYLRVVEGASAVISTRMHGCLLAALTGIPVVPLVTYDPKLESIASRLDLPCIRYSAGGELSINEILSTIQRLGTDTTYRFRLESRIQSLRQQADDEDDVIRAVCRLDRADVPSLVTQSR